MNLDLTSIPKPEDDESFNLYDPASFNSEPFRLNLSLEDCKKIDNDHNGVLSLIELVKQIEKNDLGEEKQKTVSGLSFLVEPRLGLVPGILKAAEEGRLDEKEANRGIPYPITDGKSVFSYEPEVLNVAGAAPPTREVLEVRNKMADYRFLRNLVNESKGGNFQLKDLTKSFLEIRPDMDLNKNLSIDSYELNYYQNRNDISNGARAVARVFAQNKSGLSSAGDGNWEFNLSDVDRFTERMLKTERTYRVAKFFVGEVSAEKFDSNKDGRISTAELEEKGKGAGKESIVAKDIQALAKEIESSTMRMPLVEPYGMTTRDLNYFVQKAKNDTSRRNRIENVLNLAENADFFRFSERVKEVTQQKGFDAVDYRKDGILEPFEIERARRDLDLGQEGRILSTLIQSTEAFDPLYVSSLTKANFETVFKRLSPSMRSSCEKRAEREQRISLIAGLSYMRNTPENMQLDYSAARTFKLMLQPPEPGIQHFVPHSPGRWRAYPVNK